MSWTTNLNLKEGCLLDEGFEDRSSGIPLPTETTENARQILASKKITYEENDSQI